MNFLKLFCTLRQFTKVVSGAGNVIACQLVEGITSCLVNAFGNNIECVIA